MGGPVDVSKELAELQHEKKNQSMKKLPPNAVIQRRPLDHPAIPPPLAGAKVQKVVYVSRRTPVMSAVKRVKKLLGHIEKRALQGIEAKNNSKGLVTSNLAELSDKLAKNPEEILVKATGRAMEQALRVGEWFRTKEKDYMCNVEVRTGSVAAVDDIVVTEDGSDAANISNIDNCEEEDGSKPNEQGDTTLEGGDTTLDILGTSSTTQQGSDEVSTPPDSKPDIKGGQKRKRKKRKRAAYDAAEVPEARIRWVKSVEVAISLKA